MTSIADMRGGAFSANMRVHARRFRAWLAKRGQPVLPIYAAERSTWWVVLRRSFLLTCVCLIAIFYGLLVSVLPPALLIPAAVPPVVLLLLLIWALPEALNPPVRALAGIFMIFTVTLILWPNYLAFSFAGLPWISIRRLIGIPEFVILLVCLSISKKFRYELALVFSSAPLVPRLLFGFVAVQTISIVTSGAVGETINRFVDMQITWTGMFVIAAWVLSRGYNLESRWINTVIFCSFMLMCIGFFEYRVQHVIWANYIPSFLKVSDESVMYALTPNFRDRYRVLTTFSSPLSYGEFIALISPIIIHKIANSNKLWKISFWVIADIFLLISAFVSGARLSMVGYIVAHVVYLLLWSIRRWRVYPGGLLGPSLTMLYPALAVLLGVAIMSIDGLRLRVFGGGASQYSNDARREQFHLAIPAISRRPLFGYGPGQGADAIGWQNAAGMVSLDSGFLSIASDYGLIGFGLFFGMIIVMIVELLKVGMNTSVKKTPLSLALAVFFVVLFFTRSVLSQPENNPLLYMFLGLAMALVYGAKKSQLAAVRAG